MDLNPDSETKTSAQEQKSLDLESKVGSSYPRINCYGS